VVLSAPTPSFLPKLLALPDLKIAVNAAFLLATYIYNVFYTLFNCCKYDSKLKLIFSQGFAK